MERYPVVSARQLPQERFDEQWAGYCGGILMSDTNKPDVKGKFGDIRRAVGDARKLILGQGR